MDLTGKNVVYFGGCGGIGSATCKQLVQKNIANLAILDLNENTALIEALSKQSTNVFFLQVDICCKESIKSCLREVVSRMGHIDILVNGIGISNDRNAELTINVNLLGLINASLAALELMDKSKGNRGGQLMNIASAAGFDPNYRALIYGASKAGVVSFTRSLATNFESSGVSCITICPGLTRTQLLENFTSEEFNERSTEIANIFGIVQKQSPEELAATMIKTMEANKNGAVYLCDVGECEELSFPKYWNLKFVSAT